MQIDDEFLDVLLEDKQLFGELAKWSGNLGETYVQYLAAKKAVNVIPTQLAAIKKRPVVSIEEQTKFHHSVAKAEKRFEDVRKKLLRDLDNTRRFIKIICRIQKESIANV